MPGTWVGAGWAGQGTTGVFLIKNKFQLFTVKRGEKARKAKKIYIYKKGHTKPYFYTRSLGIFILGRKIVSDLHLETGQGVGRSLRQGKGFRAHVRAAHFVKRVLAKRAL